MTLWGAAQCTCREDRSLEDALDAFREGRYEDGARLAMDSLEEKGNMARGLLAIHCLLRSGQYIEAVGVVGRLKTAARHHALDCAVFDHAIGHRQGRHIFRYIEGPESKPLAETCNLLYQKTRGNPLNNEPGDNRLRFLWEADQGPPTEPSTLAEIAAQMHTVGAGREGKFLLRDAWRCSRKDPKKHAELLCVSARHAQKRQEWSGAAAQWKRAADTYADLYGNGDQTALQCGAKAVSAYYVEGDWHKVIREASWVLQYRDRLADQGRQVESDVADALLETGQAERALPIYERLYAAGDLEDPARLVHALIDTGQADLALDVLAKEGPHRVEAPIMYAHHRLTYAFAYYALGREEEGDESVAEAFQVVHDLHDLGHGDVSSVRDNLIRNLKAHGYDAKAASYREET